MTDECPFHANIPEHEAWKARVLAGDLTLDEIDTDHYTTRFGAKAVTV